MAALNYILYTEFDGKFQYGPPVHSVYKRPGESILGQFVCRPMLFSCFSRWALRMLTFMLCLGLRTDVKMFGGFTNETMLSSQSKGAALVQRTAARRLGSVS